MTYFVVNTQPGNFRLEIKYVSSEKNVAGPNVTSSEIDGGYVVVDGTQRRTLYLPCPEPNQTASNCPKIDSRSEFIVVRDDPNKPISILLNLSNEKQSTSFDVDIVPKKINCTSIYEGSKRRTVTLKPVPAKLSEATYGSGGHESTIWTARAVAPGKVIALVDWTYDDPTNMHFLNANDDQMRAARIAAMRYRQVDINTNPFFKDDLVLIVGTQNGGPAKTITMTIDYELPISSCHEQDWVVDQPRQKLTLR